MSVSLNGWKLGPSSAQDMFLIGGSISSATQVLGADTASTLPADRDVGREEGPADVSLSRGIEDDWGMFLACS